MPLPIMIAVVVLTAGPRQDATILSVRGDVQVRPVGGDPHRATALGLLYAGDRLVVPAGGEVILVFADGAIKERVKPAVEVKIATAGCLPPNCVERLQPSRRAVVKALQGIRPLDGNDRIAAAVFRSNSDEAEPPQELKPINGTTLLSDRPALAWKPVPDTKEYLVRVWAEGSGNLILNEKVSEARLAYPETKKSLKRGAKYSWTVTNLKGARLSQSHFLVATAEETKTLTELRPLLNGPDPAGLLEAALAFEASGVFEEALEAYEKLGATSPGEPAFAEPLAYLRKRAGIEKTVVPKR